MSIFGDRPFFDFRHDVDPKVVRQCLDYAYRMLDVAKEQRQEMIADGATLKSRVVMAGIQHEIEDAIRRLHRWLSRHARKGAGRSPALKGHGCPALPSAVGSALTRATADITSS